MDKDKPARGWRPTPTQETLLRAALSQGETVLVAWQQLKRGDFPNRLDNGSARLLPLLYRNLLLHGVEAPLLERLGEEYVRTWCDNQLLFNAASGLLRTLRASGVETLLLKGASLALQAYEDSGLRPMSDVDILVRPGKAELAIKLLGEGGWESNYRSPEALIPYEQAVEFRDGREGRCDLHWRVFFDGAQEVGDEEFWEAAVEFEFDGVRALALNPTDQLLHVCVHGAAWNDMPPVRWVADAAMLLGSAEIDWGRFVDLARRRRLMLPAGDTLGYLRDFLGAPVPADVLGSIRAIRPTVVERCLYRVRAGPSKPLKRLSVLHYWAKAWRLSRASPPGRKLLGFLSYLKSLWGVGRLWQAPFHLAFKAARGVAQILLAPTKR